MTGEFSKVESLNSIFAAAVTFIKLTKNYVVNLKMMTGKICTDV